MKHVGRRVIAAVAIVGGLTAVTAGVAHAHFLDTSGTATCLDTGGWQALATVTLDDNPGNPPPFNGTATASYPGGGSESFVLQSNESATFGQGVVIPTTVQSVTFSFSGTFGDGFPWDGQVVLDQPSNCTPTTTTTTTTTSTTSTTTTTTTTPTTTSTTTTTAPTTTSSTTSTTSTTTPPTTTTAPTTTTTTAPTTTLPGALTITAITPVCQRDAPFVRVVFGNQPEFNNRTATVTFIDVNGTTVAVHTATYVANGSVTFVYPGATVDAAGNATDWPGWRFDGDDWVQDPTDRYLRDGLTVRVEVNPTATGQVAYPPATSGCANPPGSSSGSSLPVTGSNPLPAVLLAAGAVALGTLFVWRARRAAG